MQVWTSRESIKFQIEITVFLKGKESIKIAKIIVRTMSSNYRYKSGPPNI